MKVRYWGTRGSIAKPGPSTIRYGGNTSCVEVRSASGCLIVIDCGTGAHDLGQSLVHAGEKPCSGHILISHTHWDHIQGLPFFAPLFSRGNEWHIYGPRGLGNSLRDVLAGQMEYAYFPVSLNAFAAAIHYHEVVEGVFRVGDFRVTAQYLNHPALTVGYRLESDGATVVYASDHEPHHHAAGFDDVATLDGGDALHRDFVRDADLLIHDAQYTAAEYPNKIGWGHSTVEYVTDIAVASKVRHLALYHHDPMRNDDAVDGLVDIARKRAEEAKAELHVSAAAEGATIELRGSSQTKRSQEEANSGLLAVTNDLSQELVVIAGVTASESAVLTASAQAEGAPSITPKSAEDLFVFIEQRWPSLIVLGADSSSDPVALCERIRALPNPRAKETPIIVLTEDGRAGDDPSKAVTDWLSSPFSMQYARARIRAWLTRSICRWRRASVPEDEERRLRGLQALAILDTLPEERFDCHTRIAAAALDVPIALVTLVDRERQWFKSRQGLGVSETPRDMAFCAHAILTDEPFIVTDALTDDRFADNPLVVNDPRVRFYAGVPLHIADGSRVGTLCVIDHKPRDLSATQLDLLKDLAKLVEQELQSPE